MGLLRLYGQKVQKFTRSQISREYVANLKSYTGTVPFD